MRTWTLKAVVAVAVGALIACSLALAAEPNGEQDKDVQQILQDVANVNVDLASWHAHEDDSQDKSFHTTYDTDVDRVHGSVRQVARHEDERYETRVIGARFYEKDNFAFLHKTVGLPVKAARRNANHWFYWVKGSLWASLKPNPDRAVRLRCYWTHLGTVTKGPTGEVDGQPAFSLDFAADEPGATAGTEWFAATGAPVLLKRTTTGAPMRGGKPVRGCHEDPDSLSPMYRVDGSTVYTHINQPVHIEAPRHAQPFRK